VTTAVGTTFRLPAGVDAPDSIPLQIAVPDLWTDSDLHDVEEILSAWFTLAGRELCKSLMAPFAFARFEARQLSEEIAAVAAALSEALHAQYRKRLGAL
jgi:hypothetical protein